MCVKFFFQSVLKVNWCKWTEKDWNELKKTIHLSTKKELEWAEENLPPKRNERGGKKDKSFLKNCHSLLPDSWELQLRDGGLEFWGPYHTRAEYRDQRPTAPNPQSDNWTGAKDQTESRADC